MAAKNLRLRRLTCRVHENVANTMEGLLTFVLRTP
jgi:hypothetical protein